MKHTRVLRLRGGGANDLNEKVTKMLKYIDVPLNLVNSTEYFTKISNVFEDMMEQKLLVKLCKRRCKKEPQNAGLR